LKAEIYQEVLQSNNPDWIRFFEVDLNLYHAVDSRVFLLKGTVKIKQDVSSKSNLIGIVPLKDKPTFPILFYMLKK
jgi:hypothetical protein